MIVFASGPNVGNLTATGNPLCSHGILGDDTWGVEYDAFSAGDGQLAGVSLKDAPDHANNGQSRIVSGAIVVAPLGTGGTTYRMSPDGSSGNFTAEVQDNGTTAMMHFAGTSIASQFGATDPSEVPIDITVNCPAVTTPDAIT